MTKAKILLIDDDDEIRHVLKILLEKAGYKVIEADNGKDGIQQALEKAPQIVLLDFALPSTTGPEIAKKLTGNPRFIGKIIMVSAHKEPKIQIDGLNSGAIDYVTKPFDEKILLAKIQSILRESERSKKSAPAAAETPGVLEKGDFKLSEITRALTFKDKDVCKLTEIQFKIFKLFLEKSPQCVSRDEILKQVFGPDSFDIKLVDIHLHHLRDRLGKCQEQIKNVYGKGYFLETR